MTMINVKYQFTIEGKNSHIDLLLFGSFNYEEGNKYIFISIAISNCNTKK